MNFEIDETITENKIGHCAVVVDGKASIVAGNPIGVISKVQEPGYSMPGADDSFVAGSAQIETLGECSVIAGETLAPGDFFTSNETGKAVATTSGFALGRVLEAGSADEIVQCVISPTSL